MRRSTRILPLSLLLLLPLTFTSGARIERFPSAGSVHSGSSGSQSRRSWLLGSEGRRREHGGCFAGQSGMTPSFETGGRGGVSWGGALVAAAALRGGSKGAPLPSKPPSFKGALTATRPWSWTAGIIPVLLTAALVHRAEGISLKKAGLANALMMVIALQASGNLVNSYVDYNYGVDTVQTAGDRSIVDALVSPRGALALAGVLLILACAAVVPTLIELTAAGESRELALTFWAGVGMVYSYTCWPFRLKYRGLGDITVFLLFGPMLMQVAALLISGEVQHWILPYGVPAALLTEAILHANNMRDIQQDTGAGISTLATTIGFRASRVLYWGMIVTAYAVAGVLGALRFKGSALAFLTLPLAVSVLKDCKQAESLRDLDEKTAKLHLLFGGLMTVGTLFF